MVAADLRKCGFGDRHERRFAFNEQKRERIGGKYHDIAAFRKGIVGQTCFDCEKRFGVTVVADQQMDKMLPYPFFGREGNEFSAYNVENMRFPVNLLNFISKRREVERFH